MVVAKGSLVPVQVPFLHLLLVPAELAAAPLPPSLCMH
jgi:hypothetical protein